MRWKPAFRQPPAKPLRNSGLVLPVRRSKLKLQRKLLSWRHDAGADAHDQASEQNEDASKENGPAEPETNFSQVHWVARDGVGTVREEDLWAPVKLNPLRKFGTQAEAKYQKPGEDDDASQYWKETQKVPWGGVPVRPPIAVTIR